MDEVLMNGFWTLLGAGIVAMAYYYGYCRGDRKRYQEMQKALEQVSDAHTEALKEAFYAGYKAGRDKKLGKANAYKAWVLTPLKEAFLKEAIESAWKAPDSDIIPMVHKEESKSEPEQKTIPAAEAPSKKPDHRCDDCVHHDYAVEDAYPKSYVLICKKGLCPTKTVCDGFEKKIIWENKVHPEDLRERMTSTYGSTQDGNKISALTRKDLSEATSIQTAESDCSKCIHWRWIIRRIGDSPEHGCALEDEGGIDLHGKCSKFEEKE